MQITVYGNLAERLRRDRINWPAFFCTMFAYAVGIMVGVVISGCGSEGAESIDIYADDGGHTCIQCYETEDFFGDPIVVCETPYYGDC